MNDTPEISVKRKTIAIRFLYTLLFLIVLEIVKTIIQVTVLFQYVYLFATKRYSNPVRNFGNKVSAYAYKIMRYLSLSDNRRPFPFSEFPTEVEPSEDPVRFE